MLLLVKERLHDALALPAARIVFEEATFLIGDDEFVIDHLDAVFLESLSLPVLEDAQVVFDGDHLIERRDEEVSATYGRVTDLDGVDDVVGLSAGFATIADPVVYLADVLTLPALAFVKLLHDSLADRLAAHIHRDEAGREEGAVFVSVDLLKDEAQHGGVDEGFVVLLYVFRALRTEVVGIEKFEEVGQRGELAGHFFALLVLQNGIGKDGQDLFVLQVGDKQRDLLDVRGFEEGAVEIGHLFKDPDHIGIALVVTACQYLKKQAVEVVEVFDLVHIEKGVRLIPLMIGDQLRLQELQKQNTVDPRDTQFQRDIEEAFLRIGAKLAGPLQPA